MAEQTPDGQRYSGEIALPKLSVSLSMPAAKERDTEAPAPPEKVETRHTVTCEGRTLSYTATAGLLTLRDDAGKPRAKVYYTAYTRPDAGPPSRRPIMFAFNGGPGSASVWLHLGAWGPRRVKLGPEGEQLPPPSRLVENEYTLLDRTDLVFIDPVGTGFSHPADGVEAKEFHGVEEDLESVGRFIVQYVTEHNRWDSPKFIGGESYGTTRTAGLTALLQNEHGLYLNGVMLVSVVLNMQTIRFADGNDLPYLLYLPSYAATGWYHQALPEAMQAKPLAEVVAEAREFAATDYNVALLRGAALDQATAVAVRDRLHELTGIDPDYLERSRLRVPMGRYNKELLRDRGRTVGRFDSRYLGIDRDTVGEHYEFDASYTAVLGAFTAAFNKYVRADLNYQTTLRYKILTGLYAGWNYGQWQNRYLDVGESLRTAMTRNPSLKVFVANGYYDLATPLFATEYTFDHLALDDSLRGNITMAYYEAGHMMYAKESELAKLATDVRGFIDQTLAAQGLADE